MPTQTETKTFVTNGVLRRTKQHQFLRSEIRCRQQKLIGKLQYKTIKFYDRDIKTLKLRGICNRNICGGVINLET